MNKNAAQMPQHLPDKLAICFYVWSWIFAALAAGGMLMTAEAMGQEKPVPWAWESAAEAIPRDAPDDSVMASPSECAEAAAWAHAAFGGERASAPATTNLDLLFAGAQLPFSFQYDGKPASELLKTWDRNAQARDMGDRTEQTVRWTDGKTGLAVTAVVTGYKRYPAVEWLLFFENRGAADTPVIENIRAMDVLLNTPAAREVILHRIAGDNRTADSFRPLETPLEPRKKTVLAPVGGRSSNGTFPFFNVACGEQGVFTAIGWSGQWSADLERTQADATRVTAGMERTRFVLHPGEKVRSPRILLMAWRGDRMDAHNRFRRLMLHHYSPQRDGRPVLIPAFIQCYDRYNGDPKWSSEEGQMQYAAVARDIGCEAVWLDAAWFPGGFPNGVGTWTTHDRLPRGLKPVSDVCRRTGMKFMLWFEPERVGSRSQIAAEHPGFVHGGSGGGLYRLDDPAARRWLTDLLLRRIAEYGLDWYRNDFNMDPLGHWQRNDAPDRQGITEIRYIEGLYAMWDELRAKNPGLVIDNCASGGRRIDLEMCMRSVALWQSDINCLQGSEDAHQAQNVCLSLYIPLHTPCAWKPDIYELRSVVTAGLVMQLPYREAGFSAEKTLPMVEEVKTYRKFWYGDLHPLTEISPSAEKPIAFELHRPDLREGIVLCFRRSRCENDSLPIVLKGLDPGRQYWVWSAEGGVTPAQKLGRDLMQTGLAVRLPEPRSSDVVTFRDAALGKPPALVAPAAFKLGEAKLRSDAFSVYASLVWEPSAGARRYRVLIGDGRDTSATLIEQTVYENRATVTGLPRGKRLFWTVQASSPGGTVENTGGAGSLQTPEPVKGVAWASDMQWLKATSGAEQVFRDRNHKNQPLRIAGKAVQKGLWVHAFPDATPADVDATPADVVFDIGEKNFAWFKAVVGLDDLGEQGSVQFQVLVDGEKKVATPVLRPRESQAVTVDVKGARKITLRVLNGGDNHFYDHGVWGFARFVEPGATDAME